MIAMLHTGAQYRSLLLALLTYVLTSLWMGALLAALAALVLRLCKSLGAGARYVVWYVALVATVIGPASTTVAAYRAATWPASWPVHAAAFPDAAGPITFPMPAVLGLAALWAGGALYGIVRLARGAALLAALGRGTAARAVVRLRSGDGAGRNRSFRYDDRRPAGRVRRFRTKRR